MTKVPHLILAFFFCIIGFAIEAQNPFTNCSAAFLGKKMVVNEYTDAGKCILSATATGVLTVCTASISPTESIPVERIKFKIAIRDKNTGTLTMYTEKSYKQVDIQAVMKKCRKGDRIVLITLDDQYALPHNEILVD